MSDAPKPTWRLVRRGAIPIVVVVALLGVTMDTWALPEFADEAPLRHTVELTVVDENDAPVVGSTVSFGDRTASSDDEGRVAIGLDRPVVAVVSKSGFLDEPVAIAPDDGEMSVRLWSRVGADGAPRASLHFGGDVMLGRRYLEPDRSTPFVGDATSARRVVAELGPMSAAADVTVANLETVVGDDLGDDLALPAKRFLIRSSPLVTEALDELGVDLVTLGNNHAYDWGDDGVTSTLSILDEAGVEHVGAAVSADDALRGQMVDAAGVQLGIVSATTVSGDYVNDQLPAGDEPAPADLPPEDAWQYEERLFGLRTVVPTDGGLADIQVPMRPTTVSEAWRIVETAEQHLDQADIDVVWDLVSTAFPELQDWVARRDHGGAAHYERERVAAEIRHLRDAGADVVVVQIHGGYQFAPVASEFVRRASRAAIDDGADAVVSHHPHVLQGVEWYGDGLIVYSLGNLVFDQDLHSTFQSALLRVVTEGDRLLEARLLPIVIDRYRPTPLAGAAAGDVVQTVFGRSVLAASSDRVEGKIATVVDGDVAPDESNGTVIRFERNSGVIERGPSSSRSITVALGEDGTADLPACTLARVDRLDRGVEFADELLEYGTFDRATTAARRGFPVGWLIPSSHERWGLVDGAGTELGDLALELTSSPDINTTLRITALVDVPRHRLLDDDGEHVDAEPSYELRMVARRDRGQTPFVRLATYARHDIDPTVAPRTDLLEEIELAMDIPKDDEWHDVTVDIPDALLRYDGDGALALNLTIVVPAAHLGTLAVDDVQLLEWRGTADADEAIWLPASSIRSAGATADVDVRSC
jgi:poly-gamma-glutamate capsule biosynthesis protein CapA/YwtB (metallophosphatase superfamily)